MTVLHALVTEKRPPFILTHPCRRITPKDDRITTLCTEWITPSITIVRNPYAYAQNCLRMLTVPKSEAEILRILKLP